jgi:predicted nucleotidyltransferase
MTKTPEELLKVIEGNSAAIRGFGVRRLALFGSCARGEDKPTSDVDVLVDLETKTFDAYMDLKFFLEDLLHRPVDLVLESALKPRLRAGILKEAIHASGL